jgi:hypothetical protein
MMRRKGLNSGPAALFLAVFILGSLYYFFCGDPCPFHRDRPSDALSGQGGQAHFHCLCAWSAFNLPAVAFNPDLIDCLGFCPSGRSRRPPDFFVQDITHPPQLLAS